VEHPEVPVEDAVVKPVKGRKKRHRGQEASCRATWRAKETDPRSVRITEDIGCRLQEGVQPCNSSMAQKRHLQEILDPKKLWTTKSNGIQEEVYTLCRTQAHGTRQRRCHTKKPKRRDVREEIVERPGIQHWHKGPRPDTANYKVEMQ
jgi:hypothetical protein